MLKSINRNKNGTWKQKLSMCVVDCACKGGKALREEKLFVYATKRKNQNSIGMKEVARQPPHDGLVIAW